VKLSIAMCTYNGAAYLPEQLESLAAQTRRPDELVVCDDASDDGHTREIVKAFARKSKFRVRVYINQETLGSKKNFERAIRHCRGDIILLCDQDDIWKANKLARIEEAFLSAPDVGLVFTDAEIVDESLKTMGGSLWESDSFASEGQELIKQSNVFQTLLRGNVVTGATLAFRSTLRRLVLPIPDETILQHDAWIALIVSAVAPVFFLNEPLIKYRQHSGQQIGVSIKGTEYEERDSPMIRRGRKTRYPFGETDAFKTVYARLMTKCSRLVSEQNLNEIKDWIIRLEKEKAILVNSDAPEESRRDWIEMKEYLASRIVRVEPYIRADVSRLKYRLRLSDISAVKKAILADQEHGINTSDTTKELTPTPEPDS
jgi:glycosyltransferase involved in cell wall biosynthesis